MNAASADFLKPCGVRRPPVLWNQCAALLVAGLAAAEAVEAPGFWAVGPPAPAGGAAVEPVAVGLPAAAAAGAAGAAAAGFGAGVGRVPPWAFRKAMTSMRSFGCL